MKIKQANKIMRDTKVRQFRITCTSTNPFTYTFVSQENLPIMINSPCYKPSTTHNLVVGPLTYFTL